VLDELKGHPLWPEMKALAERVRGSFEAKSKPKPIYWWYREDGCDTFAYLKSVQVNSAPVQTGLESVQVYRGRAQRLEIARLQTEIEDLDQDYTTVATQLRNELDGSTQNKMKRQLEQICLEMEQREFQLDLLRRSHG
jgi:hypothetical protein